ncbi:MAG: hypothetical protein FWF70_07125 [Bacteroidetes bacterium]|nr:hypothetical protein [Bacteroidota bacterium]MCL1968902.1 hypothetical protein [Bacteroidota bacterium]MCL1969017.1 hypothetical protein [Bacteroidota bacterium]
MNKKYFFIFLPFYLFTFFNGSAQVNQFYSIEYSTGSLVGVSSKFINNYSWRGGQFNAQIFLIDNLAVGFKLGFNNFYSKVEPKMYDYGTGLRIYANTYRYVRTAPFQIGAVGHILPNDMIKPYVGLYLGLCYASESVMVQDVQARNENLGFILTPELGFYLQFGKKSPAGIKFSAAYNLATNHYNLSMSEYKDLQSVNVNLGLTWMVMHR